MSVKMKSSPDPLINFMKQRRGFCIHFASASALMLRSCDIPARVVGGFVSREWNPWLKRYVVREREGHAWVEAWDSSRGRWFLVEATPPGGVPGKNERAGFSRLLSDFLSARWKSFVAWIRDVDVLMFITTSVIRIFKYAVRLIFSPFGMVLTLLMTLLIWRRQRIKRRKFSREARLRASLTAAIQSIEYSFVSKHARRRKYESWAAWIIRIGNEPAVNDYEYICKQVEIYQSLRYKKNLDSDAVSKWINSVKYRNKNL